MQNNEYYTKPNIYGKLHLGNQDSVGYKSDAELYDWEMENHKTKERGCWTIQAIPKKMARQCFSMSIIPKIFERKIREYPSLAPIKIENIQALRYKERESPVLHIEQVSKNIGEHSLIQSLFKTFTSQAAQWWDTHQSRIQMWMAASTYFIKIFGGKKLTKQAQIPFFTQGQEPKKHISRCEKERRRLG